MRFVKERSF